MKQKAMVLATAVAALWSLVAPTVASAQTAATAQAEAGAQAVAGEQVLDPAALMAPTCLAYVEITRPEDVLDRILDPGLQSRLSALPGVQNYYQSSQFAQARTGVAFLEGALQTKWEPALRSLIGGGIYLGLDPAAEAALLVIRVRQPELAAKLLQTLADLAEVDAQNRGRPTPVKTAEYRGLKGWSLGPNDNHVLVGDLLLVSNKAAHLKAAVDRLLDGVPAASLASEPQFSQARATRDPQDAAWAYLRLDALRSYPAFTQVLHAKSNNVLAELLVGGVAETLKQAPYATASLRATADELRLHAALPRPADAAVGERGWFFAPAGAAELPPPAGTISTIVLARDVAGMWLARDELFDDQTNTGFAQADTQFGLFFSGRDFATEVLAELEPRLRFYIMRQEFSSPPRPAVKLPSFALVLEMKQPEEFSKHLLVGYQKIVGLVNVLTGQQGLPALLMEIEPYGGTTITKSTFLPEGVQDAEAAPLYYNFSPACARVGKYFVYASTADGLRRVIDALGQGPTATPPAELWAQTLVQTSGPEAARALADNREFFISQNMLRQGHDRAAAEREVDMLLELVKLLRELRLKLAAGRAHLWFELAADFASTAAP
jgi:hypothetical protein